MEQEYTTSTGSKIFYGLLAIVLLGFTIFLSLVSNKNGNGNTALLIMPLFGIIGASLIVINLIKRKVTISDHSICRVNVWGTKEIMNDDVQGFRVGDKAIIIYPIDKTNKKLIINDYSSIGNKKELIVWLSDKFKDLNKAEFEASKHEVLQDTTLGATEDEREQTFKNTRKYTTWYSMVGMLAFTLTLLLHADSRILGIILLIFPLIGIVMMAYSKGLIRLFAKKNSAYISIFIGILFPALSLSVQSLMNAKLLSYDKMWSLMAIAAFVIFIALYVITIKKINDKILSQLLFALIFAIVYSFGAVSEINCGFDQSNAKIFPVTVIDRYVTHGKSTSYHITIDEWRPDHSSESINVSESFYDSTPIGSKVKVNLKKGALKIPWYYITK